MTTLVARIEAATGVLLSSREGEHQLAGMFTRYRPNGAGLRDLLSGEGVECEVFDRLMHVFAATSSGWDFGDWYFIVKSPPPMDDAAAIDRATSYLRAFERFAAQMGADEIGDAIRGVSVVSQPPSYLLPDDDLPAMIYECLSETLAGQNSRHEILVLKEAVYSMANDYFLMAYVLAPAMSLSDDLSAALEHYFDLWRHGIRLEFYGGSVAVLSRVAASSHRA